MADTTSLTTIPHADVLMVLHVLDALPADPVVRWATLVREAKAFLDAHDDA